jgi:hypothetical protein
MLHFMNLILKTDYLIRSFESVELFLNHSFAFYNSALCCYIGIFDCRESDISESLTSTPKSSISKNISKHDITTISEEPFDDELLEASTPLANWFERTPKKRSTLPNFPVRIGL